MEKRKRTLRPLELWNPGAIEKWLEDEAAKGWQLTDCGRVLATFDGVPYRGSLVHMGVKNEDGFPCPIIGVRRDIQKQIGKGIGDRITVPFGRNPPHEYGRR